MIDVDATYVTPSAVQTDCLECDIEPTTVTGLTEGILVDRYVSASAVAGTACSWHLKTQGRHTHTGEVVGWEIEPVDALRIQPARVLVSVDETLLLEPLPRREAADAPSLTIEEARSQHGGVAAVSDLRDWLGFSVREICEIVGLAESTFYSWVDRPTTRPRASTISDLLALWAVGGIVRDRLDDDGARRWWNSGTPTRLVELQTRGHDYIRELQDLASGLAGADDLPQPPSRPVSKDEAHDVLQALLADDSSVA